MFERDFYRFNFPEMDTNATDLSAFVVGTVKATDKDKVGPNSALSYSLKHPSDYFAVDPTSGKIYPKRVVSYEGLGALSSPENEYSITVRGSHVSFVESFLRCRSAPGRNVRLTVSLAVIQVVAIDQGKPPMSGECTVAVSVVKANKNPPKFLRDEYSSPVPDTALFGQKIMQLTAVDADTNAVDVDRLHEVGTICLFHSCPVRFLHAYVLLIAHCSLLKGEKHGVTYEVVGGNGTGLFSVDPRNGWVLTSQPLLGRRGSVFVLSVRAVDNGIPPLYQEVKASLVVTGQNRFSPVFSGGRPYQVSVEENAALGKPIITVAATDDDGGDNPNGLVQYYISSGNDRGKFAINARSGTLTVAEGLDYDSVQQYVINVTASDSGFLQNSVQTSVVINVLDVNDNKPLFARPTFTFEIKENSAVNSFVGKVEATPTCDCRSEGSSFLASTA